MEGQFERRVKAWLWRLGWIASLLATLLLAIWPATNALAASPAPGFTASVDASALNLRAGPSTSYTVVSVLPAGATVSIIGRDSTGQWYQVQLPGGGTGWLDAAYLQAGPGANTVPEVAAPPLPPAAATASVSRPSAIGHHIVFQTSSGGAIYVINPDGTNLRYLTSGIDPALAPDGKTVAFTRWESSSIGATGSLWVINLDATGERQVLGFVNQPKSPTWSPDGKEIAINMQQGGTTSPQQMCLAAGPGQHPQIPPGAIDIVIQNGQVCFTLPANPYWGLRVVNVATGTYQDLPSSLHSFAPTWDPADPNRIVFQSGHGLMNMYLDQKTTDPLTTDADQWAPIFSPDGSKIAVSYRQSGNWEVHTLNADGSGEVRLTETPLTVLANEELQGQVPTSWNNAAPAWSPDGSQIAFVTDRSGHWEIWVMNADGSNPHPLFAPSLQDKLNIQYHGVDERVVTWR